jgi:dihydropteroate synthase
MFTLNCNGRLLLIEKPVVMGIINITPDSFYAGSRHGQITDVLKTAERVLTEGAAILDIGGQSSRPGSERISEEEELRRVSEPLSEISKRFPEAFISIDTFYAGVAREAVARGASIVNDISAGRIDPNLQPTVAKLKVPYVLMHMQGNPQNMQVKPTYENVTKEVLDFFIREAGKLKSMGIHDVILDPGFGFGKTMDHNFQLLHDLKLLEMLKAPLLIGVSRKSTISKTLGVPTEETLNGTTVLNTISLMNGAMILRVHDVKEAVQAITLYNSVHGSNK